MTEQKEHGKSIHVVFESRGPKEDHELELEFRRIAGNEGQWGYRYDDFSSFDFQPVFIPKSANSSGLQLADLTARPIGLSYLRPNQQNRAFNTIKPKLGELKCFPQNQAVTHKTKGSRKLQDAFVDREMPNPSPSLPTESLECRGALNNLQLSPVRWSFPPKSKLWQVVSWATR